MIPVKLYDDIQNLEKKPSSFKDFCEKIKYLFNIDNPELFTYEYLIGENQYCSLNIYTYPKFFMNDNIQKIFIYSDKNEAHTNDNEEEEGESQNPNFYGDKINEEEEFKKMNNNNDLDLDIVKKKLINEQIKKIRESKMKQNIEKIEEKNDNNIIINDNKLNENNDISHELNNIINKNFNKLKEELFNESNDQLSQIVMESRLNNIKKEEEGKIKTPNSVEEHTGISCSSCGKCPIVGIRYKCIYCPDFDYCEKCEEDKGYIHEHPFYELRYKIN